MKIRFLLAILFLTSSSLFAASNVFVGKGGKLDTFAKANWFPLVVNGIPPIMNDTFGIEYVNVKIKCAVTSDLGFYLYAPNGTGYLLSWGNGGGRNYDSTTFTDSAITPIHFGKAPFKGNYVAQSFLKTLNYNQKDSGIWYLAIYDYNSARKDVLVNWSIGFGNHPMKDIKFDSSNLPIIAINTFGRPIPGNDSFANSKFYVIDNPVGAKNRLKDSLKYPGYCGIRLHGNWSRSFPKKSYSFTTFDSKYVKKNRTLLGMPKENDWDLIANFLDKSLMRNALSQQLFTAMGHYSPRYRHVEVVVNGQYQGVYTLMEKIKIDKNRVNIPKMDTTTMNAGDSLTGGFLIKQDWKGNLGFYSKYYKPDVNSWYPYIRFVKPDIPSQKQAQYFQSFYDSFENSLYNGKMSAKPSPNWRSFMDEKSLMDYFLIQEFSINIDGYRASYYMWKNRNSIDKRIHLGPVWDFDNSFGSLYNNRFAWFFNSGYSNADFWWMKLLGNKYPMIPKSTTAWYNYGPGDTSFTNKLKCQWLIYRQPTGALYTKTLHQWIDSNATLLSEAQIRNFKQWPSFGWNNYIAEPADPKNYKQEVDSLKDWLSDRLGFMDKFMPGVCNRDVYPPTVKLIGKDTVLLEVYNYYNDTGITYNDNYGATNVTVTKTSNLDTSTLGKYFIRYTLTDKAGNSTAIQRIIWVIDTIKPKIVFTKGDTLYTEVNQIFNDSTVRISDNYDKSLFIKTVSTFNFSNNIPTQLGFYYKKYVVGDHSNNMDSATLIIKVGDSTPPKIKVNGKDTLLIEVFNPFNMSDVSITDNYDKNPLLKLGSNLKTVNTDKLGYFPLTYVGIDSVGNKDSVKRTLNVVDTIKPKVSLIGRDTVFLKTNAAYQDSGIVYSDNYDKNLRIDTTGNYVNTNNNGLFSIVYTVTDQSGNKSIPAKRLISISQGVGIESFNLKDTKCTISNTEEQGGINLNIESTKSVSAILSIFNNQGKLVYSAKKNMLVGQNNFVIDLNNYAAGVYLLNIQTEFGRLSKPFILEK